MRVDQGGDALPDLAGLEALAVAAERDGYAGLQLSETRNEPFVTAALAARVTERLEIGTAIAVAFARTPMTVATAANDVQTISAGRFRLGLGSQVQPHIEKRFSMPWSRPAARMREFVLALQAIWRSWETGERLQFRGEFYTHTLMTPFFSPGPNPSGPPPVLIAGVGPRMTEVAGEVADGFIAHGFTTERYLREVTVPALRAGRATAGRSVSGDHDLGINLPAFVVVGDDATEREVAARAVRERIAFYGSTPSYLPVLDLHGWAGVHEQLYAASRRGEWQQMADLVTDEMLATFAAVGTPEQVAEELRGRFGDVADRLSFYAPYELAPTAGRRLLAALQG